MFLFVIAQTLFSSFYQLATDTINLYPAYTWKIFHTQPDRFIEYHEVLFHQIDDQVFIPPLKGLSVVEKAFPHISTYEFSRKAHLYARSDSHRQKVIEEFQQLFTRNRDLVVWEIQEFTFNPVDYYWNKKVVSEKALGKHESHR